MFANLHLLTLALMGALLIACGTTTPVAPAASDRSNRSSSLSNGDQSIRVIRAAAPQVDVKHDPRLGSATAKIAIVEFSDFQCSYCRDFHRGLFKQLKERYIDTGIVQFIYKDFPLRRHPQAIPAAKAARCAGIQGRFWEMHDALFDHQERLSQELYAELAGRLNLNPDQFLSCFNDQAMPKDIAQDLVSARQLGINGTPSFVLGIIEGDVVSVTRQSHGAPGFAEFVREIEKLRQP